MKDKLSHQSLNIMSSSNTIVKIFCHAVTLFIMLVCTVCMLSDVKMVNLHVGVGWVRKAAKNAHWAFLFKTKWQFIPIKERNKQV